MEIPAPHWQCYKCLRKIYGPWTHCPFCDEPVEEDKDE